MKPFLSLAPQGNVAKGGRRYSVKHLYENTRRNKQDTNIHTYTYINAHTYTHKHTHILHKRTLKNLDKLFSSADQLQLSWHLIHTKTQSFSLHKTLVEMWTSTRGPGSRQDTHRWPHRCHATPFPREKKKDGRLFSMPQPRCQNSNWNQSYYILLDTVLAIFRYASMYRSYFPYSM